MKLFSWVLNLCIILTLSQVVLAADKCDIIDADPVKELSATFNSAEQLGVKSKDDLDDLIAFADQPLLPSPATVSSKINRMFLVKDLVGLTARELRSLPGSAEISRRLPNSENILRGTNRNAGLVPIDIGLALSGRKFNNFDGLRENFWLEVSRSKYAEQFDSSSRTLMQSGRAPFVDSAQKLGSRGRYELHHIEPINQGGSVYDLSNLMIVTPRFHKEILNREYHYGS